MLARVFDTTGNIVSDSALSFCFAVLPLILDHGDLPLLKVGDGPAFFVGDHGALALVAVECTVSLPGDQGGMLSFCRE